MLARFGRTEVPAVAERTAKACLLLPLRGPQQDTAWRLADRAVRLTRDPELRPYAELAKGMAEYRRGRFAESVAAADRCLARGPNSWNLDLPVRSVRAMARYRLGDADGARADLELATAIFSTRVAKPGGPDPGGTWTDRLICEILLQELDTLIQGPPLPANVFAP
jgi:hypothetical protein